MAFGPLAIGSPNFAEGLTCPLSFPLRAPGPPCPKTGTDPSCPQCQGEGMQHRLSLPRKGKEGVSRHGRL